MTQPSRIVLTNTSFSYPATRGHNATSVLDQVSMAVGPNEFVSVLGPSGCGKTTLLRLVAGLLQATDGDIDVYSEDLENGNARVGFVFQTPNLLPWMTALENVGLSQVLKGDKGGGHRTGEAMLEAMSLGSFVDSFPSELSLGMQMRVNLARALSSHPDILLLDEPFSAVDVPTTLRLQRDLLSFRLAKPVACLHVTHNLAEALALADRIILLSRRPASVLREYTLPSKAKEEPRVTPPKAITQEILRDLGDASAVDPAQRTSLCQE